MRRCSETPHCFHIFTQAFFFFFFLIHDFGTLWLRKLPGSITVVQIGHPSWRIVKRRYCYERWWLQSLFIWMWQYRSTFLLLASQPHQETFVSKQKTQTYFSEWSFKLFLFLFHFLLIRTHLKRHAQIAIFAICLLVMVLWRRVHVEVTDRIKPDCRHVCQHCGDKSLSHSHTIQIKSAIVVAVGSVRVLLWIPTISH